MSYYTAFDARWLSVDRLKIPLLAVSIGVFFVTYGVVWLIGNRRHPALVQGLWKRMFPYVWTGFSALWLVLAVGSMSHDYWKLITRLNAGNYEVVEGAVTRFQPMPCEGHRNETFVVSGHLYGYSDYTVTAGFNRSKCFGGPIREGLCVRIADVDGVIARLEIALSCHPSAPGLVPVRPAALSK